ncbi:MAG: integrase core domain-containing protein [Oscillospiraceae bacterium]|nr:integrase core domain-containing protein [Oscillospiraceae bacterium]
MNSITQEMRFRQSLMKYCEKYGVKRASRKYNKSRSYMYTPRHNGKVERSHREDHNKFYSCHSFYSCDDLNQQLKAHLRRSNDRPMRPLGWLSPIEFLSNYRVQNH